VRAMLTPQARENQDSRCLNFGLSWLLHLRRAHPEYAQHEELSQASSFAGNETDILSFLQQKALESKDFVQLSNALLAQAEAEMRNVSRAYSMLGRALQADSRCLGRKYSEGIRAVIPVRPSQSEILAPRPGTSADSSSWDSLCSSWYVSIHKIESCG